MHPRQKPRIASLGLLTAAGGVVALAAACTSTPNPNPNPNTGGNAPNAGSSGANTSGTPGGGVGGGSGGVNGMAGGGAAQGGGGAAPVGGTGGGPPVVCKAVTGVNGSGLTVSAPDISAFKYAPPPAADLVKMAYDPVSQLIVMIAGNGDMFSMDPKFALPTTAATAPLTTTMPYDAGYTPEGGFGGGFAGHRGIAFGPDGSLYVLAVRGGGNVGVSIKKGTPGAGGGARTWTTVVTTSTGFPASGTDYDHSFSGIAISPDGMHMYISSGSRTEHGETRGPVREVPLSSAILKLPTTGTSTLSNDETALAPFLFSDGHRNAFDLAFNAAGDLIGTENGPDMDLPDEVNFIEMGKHYGFPWRFGATDNPTIDAAYSRTNDKRLQAGYGAIESYVADPGFPAAPGAFTDPILNMGPDANWERVNRDAASPTQATAGLAGVTGHRSPLGLSFDTAGALCGDYYKEGFMLSYGALVPASLNDPGEDLLLLKLVKGATGYTMTAKKLATGIKAPMDSVLVGNRLFTIGFGNAGQIFVFELPTP